MKNSNMKMTVSLSKDEKKQFDKLCKDETRGPSDMFRHLLKSYVEYSKRNRKP